jgi:hypothetical protein
LALLVVGASVGSISPNRLVTKQSSQAFRFQKQSGVLRIRDSLTFECSKHVYSNVAIVGKSSASYGNRRGRQRYPMRLSETIQVSGVKVSVSIPIGVGLSTSGDAVTHETTIPSGHTLGFNYRSSPLKFSALAITSASHSASLEIQVRGVWTLLAQASWTTKVRVC